MVVLVAPFLFALALAGIAFAPRGAQRRRPPLRCATGTLAAAWDDIVDVRIDGGHEAFIIAAPLEDKAAARLAGAATLDPSLDRLDVQLRGSSASTRIAPGVGQPASAVVTG